MRSALLASIAALAGCLSGETVRCADGVICPAGTTCIAMTNPVADVCATDAQLDACRGKAAFDTCTLQGLTDGHCYGGVCLEGGCGNGRLDPSEACDDNNLTDDDGCSSDCRSTEVCGNGVRDLVKHEACDDGNHLDHDGCTSACKVETARWRELAIAPKPRVHGAAAYDSIRDRVVMFGGETGPGALSNDTFEWDGATWTKYAGISPPALSSPAMAFDGTRVILYGGSGTSAMWAFDGTQWSPLSPQVSPGHRQSAAMAYDPKRRKLVLFGGGTTALTSDGTWEWDATTSTWTHRTDLAVQPTERYGAQMSYDPVRGAIVLAGGHDLMQGNNNVDLEDTWTYDGTAWTNRTPAAGPVPVQQRSGAAFGVGSGRTIAFGRCGGSCAGATRSTLAWDGTSWTELTTSTAPQVDADFVMVATDDQIVLFGGTSASTPYSNETWVFEGNQWTQRTPQSVRSYYLMVNDVARRQVLVIGGNDEVTHTTSTTMDVLSRDGWGSVALPFSLANTAEGNVNYAVTYDHANRNVVFVIQNSTTWATQTWIWDGTWTKQPDGPAPDQASMTLGFDGKEVVWLATNPATSKFETWLWSGASWSKATPAQSPSSRNFPLVGYDAVRKNLVLFGGHQYMGVDSDETWTYDGTTWTLAQPTARPPYIGSGLLLWNPARQRVVHVGGAGLWEWDGTTWALTSALGAFEIQANAGATSLDGGGVMIDGVLGDDLGTPIGNELWELRFSGAGSQERCNGSDLDGDTLQFCDDPDCTDACRPDCPPLTTCDPLQPSCGDGTCDLASETCRTCPGDCSCAAVCGDFVCDPAESCAGDCP